MSEILAETDVRDRNVITIPGIVRDILNLNVNDRIRFERNGIGDVCLCKVISHKVNTRNGGDIS